MSKALLHVKVYETNASGQTEATYDLISDYIVPQTGTPLIMRDQTAVITLGNNATQYNSGLRASAIANLTAKGYTTGMATADILLSPGAI